MSVHVDVAENELADHLARDVHSLSSPLARSATPGTWRDCTMSTTVRNDPERASSSCRYLPAGDITTPLRNENKRCQKTSLASDDWKGRDALLHQLRQDTLHSPWHFLVTHITQRPERTVFPSCAIPQTTLAPSTQVVLGTPRALRCSPCANETALCNSFVQRNFLGQR